MKTNLIIAGYALLVLTIICHLIGVSMVSAIMGSMWAKASFMFNVSALTMFLISWTIKEKK